MIFLGRKKEEKNKIISDYCKENNIKKVFILSPELYNFECFSNDYEFIDYPNIIEYVYYYRLLQEINNDVLVVVNECLRTTNRNDLTYNCIRNFLNQTNHQIVFQYFPFIQDFDDFFILFDFDTQSKWKRDKNKELLKNSTIDIKEIGVVFNKVEFIASDKIKQKYEKDKEKLFNNIGAKDPNTIPRNLYLISGKEKIYHTKPNKIYVGRNNRFKLLNLKTYKEIKAPLNNQINARTIFDYSNEYTIFEFCHDFIHFTDFLYLSEQQKIDVLCSDLKIDVWYFNRFNEWSKGLQNAYDTITQ